jgi:hypothetical protein
MTTVATAPEPTRADVAAEHDRGAVGADTDAVADDRDAVANVLRGWSAREVAVMTFEFVATLGWMGSWINPLSDLTNNLLAEHQGAIENRKHWRCMPMDVDTLVDRYQETLILMTTAHTHADHTAAEHATDELLKPLLTAPIDQLRAFAARLAERLENDERCPFAVWSAFKHVVEPLIATRPQGKALRLRKQLAKEVAELVEPSIPRADVVTAIAAALQWRPPETLRQVKAAVQGGAAPRMEGRQSCLFLVAGNTRVIL